MVNGTNGVNGIPEGIRTSLGLVNEVDGTSNGAPTLENGA